MKENPTPATAPILATTWAELKRRKVVRAAIAYAIVAWVILQVAEVTFEPLGFPAWAMTWAVLLAILGLPVVLVLTWFFDATSHGIAVERGGSAAAFRLFAVVLVLLTVGGISFWLARVYEPSKLEREAAAGAKASAADDDFDPPPNSIAVMPFQDMSAAGDQAYLGDGIAEELLDRLARIEGLRVAARTSSFAFRERADDVKTIGRALDVAYVLEGSVRKVGDKTRVTAQLIAAKNGFHVFSETYERDEDDVFELQDEVTAAIMAKLAPRVAGDAGSPRVGSGSTDVSPDVQELYLKGREAWRQRTPESLARAEAMFTAATERDPKFARAHAGLADTFVLQADYGIYTLEEAVAKAQAPAQMAVQLDPKSAEAWASIGLLRMAAGQLDAATGSFERAMKLDPRYEMAPLWLAIALGRQGKHAEQEAVLRQAHELNPLEPVINSNLAQTLATAGKPDEAASLIETALAVTPDSALLHRTLAGLYADRGDLVRAVRAAKRALELDPGTANNAVQLATLYIWLEDFAAARAVIATIPDASGADVSAAAAGEDDESDRSADEDAGAAPPRRSRPQRQALFVRQQLLLASGDTAVDAELERECEAIRARGGEVNGEQRGLLSLGGFARLRAGDSRGAVAWLTPASGDAELLAREPQTAEAASLLLVALARAGEAEEAARWRARLLEAAKYWIEQPRVNATHEFGRALYRAAEGRVDESVAALEHAYELGFRQHWMLSIDPRLEPLARDAKFRALEKKMADDLARQRAELAR